MLRFMPLTSKRVASHRLAARLASATRASVPIHGRSTPATGGRSTSLSIAGTSPAGTGAVAVSSGFSAHGPVSGSAHRPLTASASRRAAAARSGRSVSWARVKVMVVARPVRATPATMVVPGFFQDRSTSSVASSPTRSTSWVEISWTRASVQPPNQPSMASYVALAPRFVVDISTDWTMLRRGCSLRAGALNCWTAEDCPRDRRTGSTGRASGSRSCPAGPGLAPATGDLRRDLVDGDQVVGGDRHGGCAAAASTSGSGASDPAGPGPRRMAATPVLRAFSRDGRTPWASVTTAPPSTRAPTTATAPTAVCVRRRVVPARRTMVTRGQRTSATWSRSGSSSGRMAVVGTSRCMANSRSPAAGESRRRAAAARPRAPCRPSRRRRGG